MVIDDKIAEELQEGMNVILDKCLNEYRDLDTFEAIQQCHNGAFMGILPTN